MISRKGWIVVLLTLTLALSAATLAPAANSQFNVSAGNFVTIVFDPTANPNWVQIDQNAKAGNNFKIGSGQNLIITDIDWVFTGTPGDEIVLSLDIIKGSNQNTVFVTNTVVGANGTGGLNQHLTAGLVLTGSSNAQFAPTPGSDFFTKIKNLKLILHGYFGG